VQIALQLLKSVNVAVLPEARFSAAAVSCRASWRRWSPHGDTHMASSAECASFVPTLVMVFPQMVRLPPALAMIDCVSAGWFL
jgi:hypothetical protein